MISTRHNSQNSSVTSINYVSVKVTAHLRSCALPAPLDIRLRLIHHSHNRGSHCKAPRRQERSPLFHPSCLTLSLSCGTRRLWLWLQPSCECAQSRDISTPTPFSFAFSELWHFNQLPSVKSQISCSLTDANPLPSVRRTTPKDPATERNRPNPSKHPNRRHEPLDNAEERI